MSKTVVAAVATLLLSGCASLSPNDYRTIGIGMQDLAAGLNSASDAYRASADGWRQTAGDIAASQPVYVAPMAPVPMTDAPFTFTMPRSDGLNNFNNALNYCVSVGPSCTNQEGKPQQRPEL